MNKCIIYSRVSGKLGLDNTTINVQVARLQRYASCNQLEVVSSIRGYEPGIRTNRASPRLLRHEIADKKPDVVLVHGDTTTSTAAALAASRKGETQTQSVQARQLQGLYGRMAIVALLLMLFANFDSIW